MEPTPLVLTRAEKTVLAELEAKDSKLGAAYRRLLELSRDQTDSLAPILVAHLVREMISAVPGTYLEELAADHADYPHLVDVIASTWPLGEREHEPPSEVAAAVRALLAEHEAARSRARQGPKSLITQQDPSRSGYAPEPSVDHWIGLQRRASGIAHRLKNIYQPLPIPADTRRLVDELTSGLHAVLAPFFDSTAHIDELLAIARPSAADASRVAAALQTPPQLRHFFSQAGPSWLEPLSGIRGLLTKPPGLRSVGDGLVQASAWPQGEYLERMAALHPEKVRAIAASVADGDNPRVAQSLAGIARDLPAHEARHLARPLARWMSKALVADYAAIEVSQVAGQLAEAGFGGDACVLYEAVLDGVIGSGRENEWLLDQVLGEPLNTLASAVPKSIAKVLAVRVDRLVGQLDPALRRHTSVWLRRLEGSARGYGHDPAVMLARGLYRVVLGAPDEAASVLIATYVAAGPSVRGRIGLAAVSKRPEALADVDAVVGNPERWDDSATGRHEFRRALPGIWGRASAEARDRLLRYAEAAAEAHARADQISTQDWSDPPSRPELVGLWRGRLLAEIWERLPPEWRTRLEPVELEVEPEPAEAFAEWVRSESPLTAEELDATGAPVLIDLLRNWSEPQVLGRATFEGLSDAAGGAIVRRLSVFAGHAGDIAALRPQAVAAVASHIERGVRDGTIENAQYGAALSLMLEMGEARIPPGDDEPWGPQVRGSVVGLIAYLAREDHLPADQIPRAISLTIRLLSDPDPTIAAEQRDLKAGYDVTMLALNGVRGQATTAAIDLLLWARRAGHPTTADSIANALRAQAAVDPSATYRAATGIRLPWLLENDKGHETEWIRVLFGGKVPLVARSAAWEAYLLYSRFFRSTVSALSDQYGVALAELSPRPRKTGRPRDVDEQLGIHVVMADLLGLEAAHDRDWVTDFYSRTLDATRAQVTRFLAENAASPEVSEQVRIRARDLTRLRLAATGEAAAGSLELRAMGWASRADHRGAEVLRTIVLPALERGEGATDDEPGVAALIARQARSSPVMAARALRLLVDGDRHQALPHIADEELRTALEKLVSARSANARQMAIRIINDLGARGYPQFRDLVAGDGSSPDTAG